jgi:hypothetical protein
LKISVYKGKYTDLLLHILLQLLVPHRQSREDVGYRDGGSNLKLCGHIKILPKDGEGPMIVIFQRHAQTRIDGITELVGFQKHL